jgi:hypothetical protein
LVVAAIRFTVCAIDVPEREIDRTGSRRSRGALVCGDVSIDIHDVFLARPRIVRRKVSSMRPMSIPRGHFF